MVHHAGVAEFIDRKSRADMRNVNQTRGEGVSPWGDLMLKNRWRGVSSSSGEGVAHGASEKARAWLVGEPNRKH